MKANEYIDEDDWNKLNLFEKDEFLRNELNEWANDFIEISAELEK
ncbi:MAG: hypothetical protein [Bacteriophage sp.]|nr:MAG: hypothetical protein [Bacteriophage sp.]